MVDVPGLSKLQADTLLKHVEASYGLHGLSTDATRWYTRSMDRDTVVALIQALEGSWIDQKDETVAGVLETSASGLGRLRRRSPLIS